MTRTSFIQHCKSIWGEFWHEPFMEMTGIKQQTLSEIATGSKLVPRHVANWLIQVRGEYKKQ